MRNTPERSLDIADQFLDLGLHIFALGSSGLPHGNCAPCKTESHDKTACTCLLCHGFYRATNDRTVLVEQLQAKPWSILAIRTGLGSNVAVLDFDNHPGGVNGLDLYHQWTTEGLLESTWQVRTGGGGMHAYYRQRTPLATSVGAWPGVDLKADGGYVVAPGFCKAINGHVKPLYRQVAGAELGSALSAVPAFVAEHVRPSRATIERERDVFDGRWSSTSPLAAFESALARLATLTGGRRKALWSASIRAGEAIALGLITEQVARDLAFTAATTSGLERRDIERPWLDGTAQGKSSVTPRTTIERDRA